MAPAKVEVMAPDVCPRSAPVVDELVEGEVMVLDVSRFQRRRLCYHERVDDNGFVPCIWSDAGCNLYIRANLPIKRRLHQVVTISTIRTRPCLSIQQREVHIRSGS